MDFFMNKLPPVHSTGKESGKRESNGNTATCLVGCEHKTSSCSSLESE